MARAVFFDGPKQPDEIIPESIDFNAQLTLVDEEIASVSDSIISIRDKANGVDVTDWMLVPTTTGVSDGAVSHLVRNGSDGRDYVITQAPTTSLSRIIEGDIILPVRARPAWGKYPYALVGVEEVMRDLDSPDSDYLKIEDLIWRATGRIERETRRIWKQREITVVFDGDGSTVLSLGAPIVSVASVEMLDRFGAVDDTFVVGEDYQILHDRGELYRWGGWGFGIRSIRVVATVGTADDDLPPEIATACKLLAQSWAVAPTDDNLLSERIGEYSYTRRDTSGQQGADLPPAVKSLLATLIRY